MLLHVETPGMLSSFQDGGREGYRAFGLPAAGAMDPRALAVANILVGNKRETAVLELTLLGANLRIEGAGVLALAGADLGAELNGWPLPSTGSFAVQDGDRLRFGGPKSGCRAYLAAAGGYRLSAVMGSCSTYTRGAIGGFEGRALRKGDVVETAAFSEAPRYIGPLPPRLTEHLQPQHRVRVIWGPQDDFFDEENQQLFLSHEWQVANDADRMGYRLGGAVLRHKDRKEIVSDGVLAGAIQVPGHGEPIVLLADAQTTGGYPKIATVISADLGLFGQLLPGDRFRFRAVDQSEAGEARREAETRLAAISAWLNEQQTAQERRFRLRIGDKEYRVGWWPQK